MTKLPVFMTLHGRDKGGDIGIPRLSTAWLARPPGPPRLLLQRMSDG